MKNAFFSIPRGAFVLCALALLSLGGCLGDTFATDPTYADKQKDELYKNGSLSNATGGFALFGGEHARTDAAGPGVNAFLWRAALDTLTFMPIATADPFGGVLATDWYAPEPANPAERLRLNVIVLGRDLRADGVKVTVFRETKDKNGEWTAAPASLETASALEKTILTRARQLRLAHKESQ